MPVVKDVSSCRSIWQLGHFLDASDSFFLTFQYLYVTSSCRPLLVRSMGCIWEQTQKRRRMSSSRISPLWIYDVYVCHICLWCTIPTYLHKMNDELVPNSTIVRTGSPPVDFLCAQRRPRSFRYTKPENIK